MTRIGGASSHYHIPHTPSEQPKLSSLDKLPDMPSKTGNAAIPLSELSKFILPETVSSQESSNATVKRELTALLAIVTLNGLKDGINGSG